MRINLLDLFSGIGGFHLGLERAGFKVKSYNSEIDKYAIDVYKHNFKNSTYVGSVTDVRGSQLPRIDAITFGSPCQDFSLAGKRKGMGGERSSLILEAIRLIQECQPRFFIWENVKGTFSSNAGEDFAAILQAFANLGDYTIEWQLLNTKWFLPQNRERVYLVGDLRGKRGRQVFPIRQSFGYTGEMARYGQESACITAGYNKGLNFDNQLVSIAAMRGRNPENPSDRTTGSPTEQRLEINTNGTSNTLTSVQKDNLVVRVKVGSDTNFSYGSKALNETLEKEKLTNDKVKALDLYNRKSQDISPTLTEPHHNSLRLFEYGRIRRLTPIECERLQGFPDNWTANGATAPISDTQRYKMCGNAVTVDVVEAVGRNILNLYR